MPKINVLVFPAGEINSIELHAALTSNVNIEVYGASSIERHGKYVFKNYIRGLPLITENNFFDEFNSLIRAYNIDVIFPTHDTVAEFFSCNADRISAKVVVADKETSSICRDKKQTYNIFKDYSFTPKIYSEITEYPVFIKPRKGQGSIGARLINTESDIYNILNMEEHVICEYLPGKEYTVDCFTDKDGALKLISPRSRKQMLAGVCIAGRTEELTDEIKYIAETINKNLTFNGLWFFQIKKSKYDKFKLVEISTRCSGTMCLTRAKGYNLPLLSVYNAMGYHITDIINNDVAVTVNRTLISRYDFHYAFNTIYLDFDDTVIVNNIVNLKAIWLIYQFKNQKKKIVLLTKHIYDINETLSKYCISKSLFSEIILLKLYESKAKHIKHNKAIFIDNAFSEREVVHKELKIPVFDVDAMEVLMDWNYS